MKGAKCFTDKCPVSRREYSPGQHGRLRKKISDYGLQLREKQKVKRMYGLRERQFRLYFQRAARAKGMTGTVLLQSLERRLDNVVYRVGLSASRAHARQMASHGHAYVNDSRVNIPSYLIKPQDKIQLKGSQEFLKRIRDIFELAKDRTSLSWAKVDANDLSVQIDRLPTREDIQVPIQEQLIIELYSK